MVVKNAADLNELYSVDPLFRPMLEKLGFERYGASSIVSYQFRIHREFKILAYSGDPPDSWWARWFPSNRPQLILELKPDCDDAVRKTTVRSLSKLEIVVSRWRAGFPYQDDLSKKGIHS
jgi:hypothetical protein